MVDWTERYRPTTLSQVRGNDKARDALREWAETWPDHREAVVLHGSPGVGKTSAAHALAGDMGWETVELNASDQRTADDIDRFAGRAARNATLGGSAAGTDGRQLVVVDEADNLHGTHDRGGAGAITELVTEAGQPVVLIANDYYEMSRGLRNATREIEFRNVGARSIAPALRDICRQEGIDFDDEAIARIAKQDAGDLRSAVQDLQAAASGRDRLTVEDIGTGERDRTIGVFELLDDVLKEAIAEDALQSAYATDETPDDLVKWVEHNLPKVYEGAELARGYERLAAADRWLGRVRATQEYGYWRYATDNLAAGVAAARDRDRSGWTRFGRPQFWSSSSDAATNVVRSVADAHGADMATGRREVLPFLAAMTHHCKPRELTVAMAAHYGFEADELAFVTGSGAGTNKVESIVEEAERRRAEAAVDNTGGAFDASSGAADGEESADVEDDGDGSATADTEREARNVNAESGAKRDETADDDQSGLADFM